MIKKTGILALIICLALVLLSPVLAQAQSGLTILENSVKADFPLKLDFNLSARSDTNITDVRLHYIVERESYAQVTSEVYLEFVSNIKVDVSWALEMVKVGGLPPGCSVEYWWTVEDVKGNKVAAIPVRVGFEDNRYSWQGLAEGKVTIYWYKGELSFAQEIMLAAKQALAQLAKDTGAYLKKPIKIYIYANAQDLHSAMIFPAEWTGGVNFFRYGIITIGIAPNELEWGKRAIAHELTHQVIHQMTLNPYNVVPRWLDEGLATYAEGPFEPMLKGYLSQAIAENSIISVRGLSSPFSAHPQQAYLSYAESYSLVEFLINNYGQDRMLGLLNTFREGSSYDGALKKVYGFDMDGLNALWRDYITRQYQEAGVTTVVISPTQPGAERGMHPALIVTLSGLATALLLVLGLAAEDWAWRRGW